MQYLRASDQVTPGNKASVTGIGSRLCALCAALIVSTVTACSGAKSGVVTPNVEDVFVWNSTRITMQVDMQRSSPSREPVDILLIVDRTASMGRVISELQRNADSVVRRIRGEYPHAAIGVAALADYANSEQPWFLYQDLTADDVKTAKALRAVRLANGGDHPEAYARALSEARALRWRPGASRHVVLIGDAPAHDSSFYGTNFGVDPGRDAIVGTGDDVSFVASVRALAHDRVTVLALFDDSERKELRRETRRGFDFIAHETRGASMPITSVHETIEVILRGLRTLPRAAPTLSVPEQYREWISSKPFVRTYDASNLLRTTITIAPPSSAADGIYRIPLMAMHDSSAGRDSIGAMMLTVRVGLRNYSWRNPLLFTYSALLLTIGAMRMRRYTYRFVLYERNRPVVGLLSRVVLLTTAVTAAVVIWKFSPGTINDSELVTLRQIALQKDRSLVQVHRESAHSR